MKGEEPKGADARTEPSDPIAQSSASTARRLLSVEDAHNRIVSAFHVIGEETIPLSAAFGRVMAAPAIATLSHPPAAISAMDGYALRSADAAALPATLRKVGVSRAGQGFGHRIKAGECVRIFTGAPLPEGADAMVLQEDAEEEGDDVTITAIPPAGRFIREGGVDVAAGSAILAPGTPVTARALGLLAASGNTGVRVRRKPRVALFSTGDELAEIGDPIRHDQIIDANRISLAACISAWGGMPIDLGIVRDDRSAVAAIVERVAGVDLMVSSGGASVGEHDLVRNGLAEHGLDLAFWRIAMRPGKPLMFGRVGRLPFLGLPGNPVSALVCALLFLRPALRSMLGLSPLCQPLEPAFLASPLPMNDQREDYLRALIEPSRVVGWWPALSASRTASCSRSSPTRTD